MTHLRGLVFAALVTATATAAAGDLGVHGKVWPIIESDFRETLVRDAAKVDWAKAQGELLDNVKTWLNSRPAHEFPSVAESKTVWLDLTYELDRNIDVPTFNEQTGEYAWRTLYPKGTKVNPLDFQRPHDALVFFDARDEEQVRMVQRITADEPFRWMLIQTAGNPGRTSETIGRPVFHYLTQLGERFRLAHVPAIVFAGNGEHSRHYGVAYLAAPYPDATLAAVTTLAFPPLTAARSAQ